MPPPYFRLLAGPLLLFAGAAVSYAQNGTIEGVVLDPAGASVPNAKVSALDQSRGVVVRDADTAADGAFRLRLMPQGTYTIRIEASGFRTLIRSGLVLDPGQIMALTGLTLQIGEAAERVEVTAETPVVETATAQKSYVISPQQVADLSLNGRDFASLMRTLPGVTSLVQSEFNPGTTVTMAFNTNGLRHTMNALYLDGNQNQGMGTGSNGNTQLSLDAVGEFKVMNGSFSAEYGRSSGVIINTTTKRGTEEFHGALFEFARNDALDARYPLDISGRKTKLRFNQFGGNLGGPLYVPRLSTPANKRLFFFFNYETTRMTKPNGAQFVDIPHGELLDGDFRRAWRSTPIRTAPQFLTGTVFAPGSIKRDNAGNITDGTAFPNNTIPRSLWSRNAPAFLKILKMADRTAAVPTPNAPELVRMPLADTYSLTRNQPVGRLDYYINSRTTAYFRWLEETSYEKSGQGINSGAVPYPVLPTQSTRPARSVAVNLVNILAPRVANEFTLSHLFAQSLIDIVPGTDPATYDFDKLGFGYKEIFPSSNLRHKYPRFNCGVGSCNFLTFEPGSFNSGKAYDLTDNFTFGTGSHTFKSGAYFNLSDQRANPRWVDAGAFNFGSSINNPNDTNNGLGNLLTGYYTDFQQSRERVLGNLRYLGLEFYGQDTWKATRRLTIELGVRYVFLGPVYTRGQYRSYWFDPGQYDPARAVRIDTSNTAAKGSIIPNSGDPLNGLVQEGAAGIPAGFADRRKNQFSPRLGFAYDPFGDGKTSIRGGFGIFFERIAQNWAGSGSLANPPISYTPVLFAGQVDDLSPATLERSARFPVALVTQNRGGKIPTITSWSFGVQREMPGKMAVDVAYVGNIGRNLQIRSDVNQLTQRTTTHTSLLRDANFVSDAIRPYRGYQSILVTNFDGTSNYNSLQARVARRFASDLTANLSYTWSKALTVLDFDNNSLQYYLDRKREYGPSGYDRPHVFSLDFIYRLPKAGTRFFNTAIGRGLLDGWDFSGIVRFWTGLPGTAGSPGNPGTLGSGVRADYVSGELYPERRTQYAWFNPLAFARPLDGEFGNTGKGILRWPGVNNWDLSLFKNTKIHERVTLQFRLETFNTFNHPQWFNVNLGINVPNPGQQVTQQFIGTTGQVVGTRDPRNIQLAMKLMF